MKTEHIQKQLDFFVRDKTHHAYRRPAEDAHALAETFAAQGLDDMQRCVARLRYVLEKETPIVFPDDRITLLRTVRTIPEIHTEEEDRQLHETHAFHENGRVFNMCPDYGMLMADGFTKKAEAIRAQKIVRVKRLLKSSALSDARIAACCGFRNVNALRNLFRQKTGMSMRTFAAMNRRRSPKAAHAPASVSRVAQATKNRT